MVCIEEVDPIAFADCASRILQDAWRPPCLHYSPRYLRWQFSFPGPLGARAVAAFEAGEPIGFAGVTPRNVRYGSVRAPVYILSFVAVRPSWRGQGIVARLYATLLAELRRSKTPIVTFAEVGTSGQRCLRRAYSQADFACHSLGFYIVHGYIERPNSREPVGLSYASGNLDELQPIIDACKGHQTLLSAPDRCQLEHYHADARRALIVARRTDGSAVGAAFLVQAEVHCAHGVETVPMIENLFLPLAGANAETMRGFFWHAQRYWPNDGNYRVVTASNLRGIDPSILRAAGVRQTPSRFEGFLCVADPRCPWLTAEETTLEVV